MVESRTPDERNPRTVHVEYRGHRIIVYQPNEPQGLWMAVIQPPGAGHALIDLPKSGSLDGVLQQARGIIDRRNGP
jgi:hypothetical protein